MSANASRESLIAVDAESSSFVRPPRNANLDLAKNAAVFAVIVIHCSPWLNAPNMPQALATLGAWWVLAARFAVPFFFVASGYYFVRRCAAAGVADAPVWRRTALRLAGLQAAWSAFYLLAPGLVSSLRHRDTANFTDYVGSNLENIFRDPFSALLSGTYYHLWFLSALLFGLTVIWLLRRLGWVGPCLLLLAPALIVLTYAIEGPQIPQNWLIARNLIMAATFTALGAWWAVRKQPLTRRVLGWLVGGGAVALALEGQFLTAWRGVPLNALVVAAALFPLSLGLFAWALGETRALPRPFTVLQNRCSLGIYVLHPPLLLVLVQVPALLTSWGQVLLPFVVYATTLAVVLPLSRTPGLRHLFM